MGMIDTAREKSPAKLLYIFSQKYNETVAPSPVRVVELKRAAGRQRGAQFSESYLTGLVSKCHLGQPATVSNIN